MPFDITVIIVSYNTCDMLRDCLESVFAETHNATIEVIVVDNASSDGSQEMVTTGFPQVRLIANSENRGFAAANNQAIRIANGDFFVLLNSDTVILDGAIDRTFRFMKGNRDVGALGPKVIWPDGELQSTIFRFHSVSTVAFEASYVPLLLPRLHFSRYPSLNWEHQHDIDAAAGCFLCVRREVVTQVGELDEDFFMYGEEAEWCYRMKKAGWRVVYYPGATIIHIFGGSSRRRADSLKVQLAKRRAILLFIDKTQGYARAWVANAIMLIGHIPRLIAWIPVDLLKLKLRRDITQAGHRERFEVLWFHTSGLIRTAWRPARSDSEQKAGAYK